MTFSQEDAGLSATQFSSEPPVGLVADSPRDAKSLLAAILASLDDAKAEEIVEIDIAGKTPIADYMVVCSGRSQRHVGAIADHLPFPADSLLACVLKRFEKKGARMVDLNQKAFAAGRAAVGAAEAVTA